MNQASPYPAGHPCAGKPAHTHVTQAQSRKCEALRKQLANHPTASRGGPDNPKG